MTIKLSNAAAIAACNAVVDLVDAGAGAGYVQIRSGTQPASPEVAASGTLLATLTFSDPAFGAAAMNGDNADATANAITGDTAADASGTASWYRVYDSNNNPIFDGSVTGVGGGGDMEIDDVNVVQNGEVNITSFLGRHPR